MARNYAARKRKSGSRPVRRRLGPDARRSELLQAALGVLSRLGPHRARVEDVTRAAGAAKGTFYLYFTSWNDLLVAVREHLVSTYAAEVRARLAAAPALRWAAIEKECVRFVDFVVGLGELHEAIFHGPIADQPIRAGSSAAALIAEMLEAAVAAGACRPVAADLAAPLLFSALHATADGIARSGGRKRRLETLLELLRAWLRA
jgi:AcrR family transcriptional regulator